MIKPKYLAFLDKMENIIPRIQDDTFDCVLTDPPFGVRKEEEWDDKDIFINSVNYWLYQCLRVSKSTVIWFCASKMMPYIFDSILNMEGGASLFHRMHIWEKPKGSQFAGASHNNIWYSIEPILIFTKNKDLTISYGKSSLFNYDKFEYRTVSFKEFNHPTSKPLGLIANLMAHYTDKGCSVFDPFAGSFTTTVAGLKIYRKTVCVEKDPEYYKNGMERIKNIESEPCFWDEENKLYVETQLNMFTPPEEKKEIEVQTV